MNLRDLEYFLALAKYQHFGKAAAACFVSQPGLSAQLKKLEAELGVQLVERNNKSVLLTDVGARIVNEASAIIQQVRTLKEIAEQAQHPYAGTLKLGIIPTVAPYLLPHIIKNLAEQFSLLKFYFLELQTEFLVKALKEGEIDAAILALPINEAQFSSELLYQEDFLLAVPKTHRLAGLDRVRLQALQEERLLLLAEGHCLGDQALAVCASQNALAQDFRATSLETLRNMVAAGTAVTLIPKLACLTYPGIHYLEFDAPKPGRTIGLVFRNSSGKVALMLQLVTQIKTLIQKL